MFSLTGKNIVITGASSGIGKEIALTCNKQGANVLMLARDIDKLNRTIKQFTKPTNSHVLSIDLTNNEAVKTIHEKLREFGPIAGFVHAAGVSPTTPFKNLKYKDFTETFQLNVWTGIELSQMILRPEIRANVLSMVFISSVMSITGEKGKSLYSMSKSALIGMVKSCALEYANKEVRFNAISPSVVDTPLSMSSEYRKDEKAMLEIQKKHPLGIGKTSDVAAGAIYLLSDESRWVTGTNLIIDGGYLAI